MSRKIKVYVVGHSGPEHNSIESIHKTYKGALKAWDIVRIDLLEKAKYFFEKYKNDEMWQRIVNNLSCEDPEKINNSPHETPYISEWDLEE